MKKILVLIILLFELASANENCRVLADIFTICADSTPCNEKMVPLYFSLKERGINEQIISKILTGCEIYCQQPKNWDKNIFLKKCQSINK